MKNITSIFSIIYILVKLSLMVVLFQWLSIKLGFAHESVQNRFLFIGDSHSVGPFGSSLDAKLRSIEGASVETRGACGSIAKWYINGGYKVPIGDYINTVSNNASYSKIRKTPKMSELISSHKPNFFIVELGANYEHMSDSAALADMKKMTELIHQSGAKCLWVTVPAGRSRAARVRRLGPLIKQAVEPICEVFESYNVTQYPERGGDGVHYSFGAGTPIAKKWATLVFERVKALL